MVKVHPRYQWTNWQKYLKPVLQKLGTLQFPSPNGLGFQVKKTDCYKFESWKKIFHILAWAFFTRITQIDSQYSRNMFSGVHQLLLLLNLFHWQHCTLLCLIVGGSDKIHQGRELSRFLQVEGVLFRPFSYNH